MNRIILEHGVKTSIKNTSAKINVGCAIADEITESGDNGRITLVEHFNRCKRKYKYVEEKQFDYQFEMLSEFFKFVDEIPEDHKKNCRVEYQNNEGYYERIPLFD